MEEKHDIVAPVFKAKGKLVSKAKISPQPVVKMKLFIILLFQSIVDSLYVTW